MPTDWAGRMSRGMRVGVIDVGSNTVRLLVAERGRDGLEAICQRRAQVGLGAEIERSGEISWAKLAEASLAVRAFALEANELGAAAVDVVVASPGRQAANAGQLIRELARAAAAPVRVLSREDEARLAYAGALAVAKPTARSVAVCDVGGGSTQIAFGTPGSEPVWARSLDIGSLRLTERLLAVHPPSKRAMAAARLDVRREFEGLAVPLPKTAFAVGGSARGIRRLVGDTLGPAELDEAIAVLRKRPAAEISELYRIDPARVRTLIAGALILTEIQRRLGVPLEVVRGGLREGLALLLLDELAATRVGVRSAS
jgi:exopolyphosphatase / guanosine-5'-triphosphate,3'-diphosphate pyrophosphatase